MKNIIISLVVVSLMICSHSTAEEGTWNGYYNCRAIRDIAVEDNYLWCSTIGGLVRRDTDDGTYEIFPSLDNGQVFRATSIFIDKTGNKWVCLSRISGGGIDALGIGRFDGESWDIYNFGISFNYVYEIAEDNDGVMWFATEGGILSFDGVTWNKFTTEYTTEDDLYYKTVTSVAIAHDGSKWFATYGGVSRFDGTTWTNYTKENSGLVDNIIYSILVDLKGVIWFRSDHFIVSFDGTKWESYPYGFNRMWWWSHPITVDENNVKWIIAREGVMSFNGTTWTSYTKENSGLASNKVLCCATAQGKQWFVTSHDFVISPDNYYCIISEFDGTTWKNYKLKEEQLHAPQNVEIIFVDHINVKWISGQYFSGLKRFDGSTWFSFGNEKRISAYINSIVEDHNGVMWFGTYDGLARLEGEILTFYDSENSGLPENKTGATFIDHYGLLWVSTNSGLCKFDGSTWTVYTTENSGLPDDDVKKIDEDQNGVMWFTYWFCVRSFDGIEWKVYNTENTEIDNFDVHDIFIDKNNVKWFATSGGITSFDDTKWENYNTQNSGLVYDNIRAILVDSRGNLWAGHYKGVSRFDGNTWTTYTMENSLLPSNSVYDIAEDHDGIIWIGTFDGIVSYDPGTSTFVAQKETQPELVSIQGAYPNPFNTSTTISFTLPASGFTQLVIYNITGQKVRELVSETMTAGIHNVMWDGRNNNGNVLSSGVYISRLSSGKLVTHKRMLLMK